MSLPGDSPAVQANSVQWIEMIVISARVPRGIVQIMRRRIIVKE